MTSSMWVDAMYIVAGLLFAGGAVFLQYKRSMDIAKLDGQPTAVMSAEFSKFKFQTTYPVIALYAIALVCCVAVPVWTISHPPPALVDETPVTVTVPLHPHTDVNLTLPKRTFDSYGGVPLTVYKSSSPFVYSIQADRYGAVTLLVWYDRDQKCVFVEDSAAAGARPKCLADHDNAVLWSSPFELAQSQQPALAAIPARSPDAVPAIPLQLARPEKL